MLWHLCKTGYWSIDLWSLFFPDVANKKPLFVSIQGKLTGRCKSLRYINVIGQQIKWNFIPFRMNDVTLCFFFFFFKEQIFLHNIRNDTVSIQSGWYLVLMRYCIMFMYIHISRIVIINKQAIYLIFSFLKKPVFGGQWKYSIIFRLANKLYLEKKRKKKKKI